SCSDRMLDHKSSEPETSGNKIKFLKVPFVCGFRSTSEPVHQASLCSLTYNCMKRESFNTIESPCRKVSIICMLCIDESDTKALPSNATFALSKEEKVALILARLSTMPACSVPSMVDNSRPPT